MNKIVLFASGNGTNVQQIADYFAANPHVEFPMLFCNNPKAYVLQRVANLHIPSMVFNRNDFFSTDIVFDKLKEINPDMIVLAGFLWLVPEKIINAFPQKIINIHPALLPKYGGKGMYGHHVHEAVVANHEPFSGITIHYVNQYYDSGDIIFQATCPISATDNADNVAEKIHLLEKEHFPKVIDNLLFGNR